MKIKIALNSAPESQGANNLEEIVSKLQAKVEELAKDSAKMEELERDNAQLKLEIAELKLDNKNLKSRLENTVEDRDYDGERYDCFSTALYDGEIQYAWWEDRHGDPQYYWDGSHAGEHMCNCGLTGNCVDPTFSCNCDAEAPQWEYDACTIINRTALPITELRFGGLLFDAQKANHTLGALVCKGRASLDNPAGSCSSLRQAGHIRTGYYLIRTKKGRLDVVLCRMDLEDTDVEFQRDTGARIVEEGVYFDAYRTSTWTSISTMQFQGTEVNIGDAMAPSSGIFTAPLDGIYAFHIHFWTDTETTVTLRKNEETKAATHANDVYGAEDAQTPGQSVLLQLSAGDKVTVYLNDGEVLSNSNRYTHFVGYLLYPM
ncbi:unnamed protein product [Darwinula stevensoni]|uniref:C1q domain-containing protein n=1 Tax=Darwinula stevensoni TaxID=69355 RepID=A0A7R8X850_9CRUS|nr:unnamed protein product [Darwinula stevensoni]CAG0889756.1 unnamed protein product [Darwinula stevensoni]